MYVYLILWSSTLKKIIMTYHSIVRFSIKEENFAIVPSPVSILDIVENQTCQAILTAHLHLGHAAFEVSWRMFGIVVIPNEKWNFGTL